MFPCSEDDPASPVYLPPCLSSPPEGSLGLSLAQLLMEGELSVAGRVESVGQCTLCFTNLSLLCVVMWGSG